MLQVFGPCPLITWFFGWQNSLPHEPKWPKDIDDVIQPSNFCFYRGIVHLFHHLLCSLFQGNGGFPINKQLEETTCQVFKWLLLLDILNFVVFSLPRTSLDSPDCLIKSFPFVVIFSSFAYHIQTLKDVYDIIYPPPLNTKL